MPALKGKRERFAQEYVIDHNATNAAKRAGYSEKAARTTGYRLLKEDAVVSRIGELESNTTQKLGLTAEYVLSEGKMLYELARDELLEAKRERAAIKEHNEKVLAGELVGEVKEERDLNATVLGQATRNLELIGKHRTIAAWKEQEQAGGANMADIVERLERAMDRAASKRLTPEEVGLSQPSFSNGEPGDAIH